VQAAKDLVLRGLTSSDHVSSLRSNENVDSVMPLSDRADGRPASHLLVENTIPKPGVLQVQAKRDELTAKNKRLRRDQTTMHNDLAHLRERLTAAEAARERLASTIAGLRVLIPRRQALEERHQLLLSQLVTLERDLELLRVETNARRDHANQDWAMAGIAVLLAGMLAGALATRVRW
jgi:hypothetical protein